MTVETLLRGNLIFGSPPQPVEGRCRQVEVERIASVHTQRHQVRRRGRGAVQRTGEHCACTGRCRKRGRRRRSLDARPRVELRANLPQRIADRFSRGPGHGVSRVNLIYADITNNDVERLTPLQLAEKVVELQDLGELSATICQP